MSHTHLTLIWTVSGKRAFNRSTTVSLGSAPLDVGPSDQVMQAWISPALFDILFPERLGLLWAASATADTIPALPSPNANNSIKARLALPYLCHMASFIFLLYCLDKVCVAMTGRHWVMRWGVIIYFAMRTYKMLNCFVSASHSLAIHCWLGRWSVECCVWMTLLMLVLSR